MILYAARGRWADRRKYRPRHFAMLAEAFAPGQVRWADHLSELPHGGWALVIHALNGYSLDPALAARHSGGLYVFGALSREERRALDARNGVLVLDLDWDPLAPSEEVVAGLIGSIDRFGLDPARIRLMHSNQAGRASFEAHWSQLTRLPPVRTLEFPTSFALAVAYHGLRCRQEDITSRIERARAALHSGSRSKLFNSFNGGLRAQRLHLVAWLHHADLLERGHVSLLGYRKGPRWLMRLKRGASGSPPEALRASLGKMPYADKTTESLREVWRRLPLTLDLKRDFRDHGYERVVWESPEPQYYDDSWFSVVAESRADALKMLHITEKVAKPILNAHPFLALGSQNAMAQLRAYGFESFAPQFDERFDAWPWPKERMRLFLEEIRRLGSLEPGHLRQLCIELWPRCEHNYRHFFGGAPERLAQAFRRDVLEQLS